MNSTHIIFMYYLFKRLQSQGYTLSEKPTYNTHT